MSETEPVAPAEVAAGLSVVLAAAEAGEIEARPEEIAYLAGAVDALAGMAAGGSSEAFLADRIPNRSMRLRQGRRPGSGWAVRPCWPWRPSSGSWPSWLAG